jgi:Chagasin family peptidase inhibitor I42
MSLLRTITCAFLTFSFASCLANAPGVAKPTESEKQNNPFLFLSKKNTDNAAPVETKISRDIQRIYTVSAEKPTVAVRLPSSAGTGYQWFIQEYPAHWVKVQSHQLVNKSAPGITGGAMEDVWELRLTPECFVSPQAITLKFVHQRSWESNDAVVPLTITVLTIQ